MCGGVLQVGLDNAGKTTALYKLSLGQTVTTVPTIGSNVERVKLENVNFEIWDLGGQASLRPSWSLYLKGVDAVIVVVDSTDRVRMPIAKQELYQILAMPELEKVPFLLLANKQVCHPRRVGKLCDASECHSDTCAVHSCHLQ
jgi:ADP-ribosylation factor-like protein 5B